MKRWVILLAATTAAVCIFAPGVASADVNDFTITKFDGDYTLGIADPQGSLDIIESINVAFSGYNHGILRAIPQKYNDQSLRLRFVSVQRDGNKEDYSTYTSNGNTVLKIGNPNQTITGQHRYKLVYHVDNVIRITSVEDVYSWNTNGTGWSQPFLALTARLHLPNQLAGAFKKPICYTGAERSIAQDCNVSRDGNTITYATTRPLQAGETMTFAGSFPSGTFAKPTLVDWWHDNWYKLTALIVPVVLAFFVGYRKWNKDGRDSPGRGTIVPEYMAPHDLSVAEADALLHFSLSNKGVSATIIDLAIRHHLRIVEAVEDGLLSRKKTTYTFEKLAANTDQLLPHEQIIIDGLFKSRVRVTTDELKTSFYKTVATAVKTVDTRLVHAGFLPKNSNMRWLGLLPWMLLFGLVAAIGFAGLWQLTLGAVGGVVVLIGFALVMSKRTALGVAAKDSLEGLKLYMNTAEKDRMAMLQSPNAPYASQSGEPAKTVDLFEKLLPYAIVLGVEKGWAKQFEGIYSTPPDWYGGNWSSFNTGYLVGSLGNSLNAMNSSFAAPSSGSSSGAGSFSGGGGGGGGGGGW